jgi:ethanolamine utilization cobalamin adenosyltransferase
MWFIIHGKAYQSHITLHLYITVFLAEDSNLKVNDLLLCLRYIYNIMLRETVTRYLQNIMHCNPFSTQLVLYLALASD